MFKDLFKSYIYPIAVFSGGMIGVGFFSLPYIAMKVGVWEMLGYFLVLTGLVVAINLIFCKISLKTPDYKRFPGFVGYYLGKWPKIFSLMSVTFSTFGVLLVYLLVGGQFLASFFQLILPAGNLVYVLVYFFLVSIIIYFDIKVVAKAEFWVLFLLFSSLVLIFFSCFAQIKISNIFITDFKLQISNLFLPYGPILFALWGIGLIPEVEEMIRADKKRLKSIITISTLIVSVFYLLFIFLILGISGNQTDQSALTGLKFFLPNILASAALLIGAFATFTAFVTQGTILKKTLIFDLKIKHWQAFVMTCSVPLILFLAGLRSFIPLLSFIGGVLLGVDGIFILMMYKKIGGKKIIIYPLSLVFLFGIIYEIMYFIK